MSRRSRSWREGLARDLRKREFAREYVLALVDEGLELQAALRQLIRAYGVREFAAKAKMPASNVLRSIGARHNPTQRTLERLLRPLGLRFTAAPARRRASS